MTGSTPAKKIQEYVKDATTQIVLFDGVLKCVDALKTGQVDAVTTDNMILLGYVSEDPTAFKILDKPFTQEPYGIGVKKDDTELPQLDQRHRSRRSTRTAPTPRRGRTRVGDVAPAPDRAGGQPLLTAPDRAGRAGPARAVASARRRRTGRTSDRWRSSLDC